MTRYADKPIQAKHLDDEAVLRVLDETRNDATGWSSRNDVLAALAAVPPKVVAAKLRSMRRRRVISGCVTQGCTCRGDFAIDPDYPREFASQASVEITLNADELTRGLRAASTRISELASATRPPRVGDLVAVENRWPPTAVVATAGMLNAASPDPRVGAGLPYERGGRWLVDVQATAEELRLARSGADEFTRQVLGRFIPPEPGPIPQVDRGVVGLARATAINRINARAMAAVRPLIGEKYTPELAGRALHIVLEIVADGVGRPVAEVAPHVSVSESFGRVHFTIAWDELNDRWPPIPTDAGPSAWPDLLIQMPPGESSMHGMPMDYDARMGAWDFSAPGDRVTSLSTKDAQAWLVLMLTAVCRTQRGAFAAALVTDQFGANTAVRINGLYAVKHLWPKIREALELEDGEALTASLITTILEILGQGMDDSIAERFALGFMALAGKLRADAKDRAK